jgi:6-pyruvoyltetrahydropterin/6-carboxytetrahydropterin synthase
MDIRRHTRQPLRHRYGEEMKIIKKFSFDSAHYLPNYEGKCKQLHGHTYHLEIIIEGEINPDTGMVLDFAKLKHIVKTKAIDILDHKLLNDLIEIPTAENIALWIRDRISKELPGSLSLRLWETDDSYVEL